MATCVVSGTLKDISETAVSGAVVTARIVTPYFTGTTMLLPTEATTTSDANGAWSLTLSQSSTVLVTIDYPPNTTDSKRRLQYTITIPAVGTAQFSNLATEL